jgi:hypothetical protein
MPRSVVAGSFGRSTTLPSGWTKNFTRSPGRSPRYSRIAFGIVAWPLLVIAESMLIAGSVSFAKSVLIAGSVSFAKPVLIAGSFPESVRSPLLSAFSNTTMRRASGKAWPRGRLTCAPTCARLRARTGGKHRRHGERRTTPFVRTRE